MNYSGTPNVSTDSSYNPVASSVITKAFRIMGVINDTQMPTSAMISDGMDTLNAIVKELMATGIHVWTEREAVLFFQPQQTRYLLGPGSTDHCADAYEYVSTTLSSNAAAGSTSLDLVLDAGFLDGMQIGIVLDNGFVFWTTIEESDASPYGFYSDFMGLWIMAPFPAEAPAGENLVLSLPLPSSASAGNLVFAHQDDILRPLDVPFARRINFNSTGVQGPTETPLSPMMSRQEYMNLPNKKSPGTVTQAYYNPARDIGEMYVWNAPQNGTNGLRFTWYRPIYNFDSINNTADLPTEWDNALKWNLAKELAPDYSVPADRWDRITRMAMEKYELVAGWDREHQSVKFGLSRNQTRR